jgi:2-polyprenyl-3-methyl-5-hydroxy-6-metoxy-1,4-benzoquinol methylase
MTRAKVPTSRYDQKSIWKQLKLALQPPLTSITGERFLPGYRDGSTELEHVHRYCVALPLATKRRVLDIACGDGYGSDLLAQVAYSVTGIDSDAQIIDAANQKYRRDNLVFRRASVFNLPAEDACFDFVTCFETIQHVADHHKAIAELKRVITTDGILLLSTPNKEKYCVNEQASKFPILKLTCSQLQSLLIEKFRYVTIHTQEMVFGSFLLPPNGAGRQMDELEFARLEPSTGAITKHPADAEINEYFIALASDRKLPKLPPSIYGGDYPSKPISAIAGGLVERDRIILRLREQLAAPPVTIRDEVHADTREKDILLQDITEKDATINALRELVKGNLATRTSGNDGAHLFAPPGHYYSPIVQPKSVVDYVVARRKSKPPTGIEIDLNRHMIVWSELKPYFSDIHFGLSPTAEFRYGFENPHYSYGDGLMLQAMLRRFRPRRLIEVGSGHSSACALDTIEHFLDWGTQCTFVDPYPKLLKSLLKPDDENRIRIVAEQIQETSPEIITQLSEGDILFLDSTHVVKTGSDVCHELFEILPNLARGVIVHFHDIFYPFEYPDQWIFEENRSWNELYAMRAFLMYNTEFEILFFTDFFAQQCRNVIKNDLPMMLRNTGASLWLRKN